MLGERSRIQNSKYRKILIFIYTSSCVYICVYEAYGCVLYFIYTENILEACTPSHYDYLLWGQGVERKGWEQVQMRENFHFKTSIHLNAFFYKYVLQL